MEKITIDCIIDSVVKGDEKSNKFIAEDKSSWKRFEYEIKDVENESLLKSAVLKSIDKLALSNRLFLFGQFSIRWKDKLIYESRLMRFFKKDIIDGEFIK